jgi:uncharacterized protein (DUF1697 family)
MARTHVALLRGVNVGTAKRVAMADLRALVEGLGYTDVKTLLNSGNVVFSVPKGSRAAPGPNIQQALADQLGLSSRVTVLDRAGLATVLAENPLGAVADNPSRLLVAVLADPADRARVAALAERDWAPEVLAVGSRAAYLWLPEGIIDSRVAKALDRELRDAQTSRNWSTMLKLQALLDGD